ncbi:BON domain-containing protein [Legionella septentrionalis]|uniref:BON domain-containing protein n=1 Tax=Legionella septentrionalis TaxID=2498109 RepID=UPI000F8F5481|nr:BON domain-containing protein [Legionella septentrionalis]RUR14524.1 BON domain-containing protein [Legionella septentrionalis]
MDKFIKKKVVVVLVCSSLASYAMAANHKANGNNKMQNGQTMQTSAQPNDATLTKSVAAILSEYNGKVNVSVRGGIVYLSGELPSDTDYDKVIMNAESTKGVSDVNVDNLTVKDSQYPLNDTYITAKIKGALIREDIMGKDVPSWTVSVETKDGQVYLSGNIGTEQEKQNVLRVAKSIKGVNTVHDKMVVGTPEAGAAKGNSNGTTDASTNNTNTSSGVNDSPDNY